MEAYPHRYEVAASAGSTAKVELTSPGLQAIVSAPPSEFGGPGDEWSPETLLVAAVADCFVLSFRAITRASKFEWTQLGCTVTGVLDRVDGVTRFTSFEVAATLSVPAGTREPMAMRLLEKAEQVCLITNSLIADSHLTATVNVAD
jgi:organic hydroperoxide reductase OsmC/OhrA